MVKQDKCITSLLQCFNRTKCITSPNGSISGIKFNSVTLQALRRTSFSSKTLKTLLLSLTVSDFAVGLRVHPLYFLVLIKWLQSLRVHPLYFLVLIKWLQRNLTFSTYTANILIKILFSSASLYGVMALDADRFLIIHLHLRYQELVTHDALIPL